MGCSSCVGHLVVACLDSPGEKRIRINYFFANAFIASEIGSVVLFVWHELLILNASSEVLTCRLLLFHNTLSLVQQYKAIKCLNYRLLSAFRNKATHYLYAY